MNFLRRKIQGTETVKEEGRVIHREIEITVEREWLAVTTGGLPPAPDLHRKPLVLPHAPPPNDSRTHRT